MTPGTGSKSAVKHDTADTRQEQQKPSRRPVRARHGQQQQAADVVMVDMSEAGSETESEEESYQTASNGGDDSGSEQEQSSQHQQQHSSGTAGQHELVIQDSEGEADDQSSECESLEQRQLDAADSSSEEDDIQPFQSARSRNSRSASKTAFTAAAQTAAAATPRTRRRQTTQPTAAAEEAATPRRTRQSTVTAAATPRSTRPAAAVASTPRSTKSAAAAPAVTPCSRPVRSCRKAQQPPSLATPLAKLSLAQTQTPKKTPVAATSSKATAASSRKGGRKKAGAGRSSGGPAVGDILAEVVVDDEVFMKGDDVYLKQDDFEDVSDEEDEACEVCGSSSMKRGNPILECSTCLRGFHLRCLKPVLKKVPDGDWFCPDCSAGRQPPPPSRLFTHWQKLLYGKNELVLVHILGCQRGTAPDGAEEDQMLVRYYLRPEETHVGRQKDHGARELFLGSQAFVEPAHAIVGRAYVHSPADFAEAGDDEGNDVYLCEFEYDESLKRFRKKRYGAGDAIVPVTPGKAAYDDLAGPMAGVLGWGSHQRGSAAAVETAEFDESGRAGDSNSDNTSESEQDDESYRPELRFARTPGTIKRKRHGQLLPAEAQAAAAIADKFAGLGASDIGRQRQELRDAFGRLHASLSLSAVPSSLPCREDERSRLKGFVKRALHEDGGILYICGVPGTGKTALVMEVLAGMRDEAVKAGSQFVAINCLQLPSPQHVFSRLWEKLSGQYLGPARARDALMQLFGVAGAGGNRRKYSTLIVLDEIDMLMTRDQAVLYQLFDWPNQPGSRLGIIGISNTHDLDQRVLPRIASRLDQAKLAFAPYSVMQLLEIVKGRLAASGVAGAVEDSAVQQACRKVASETGDVRRALEMLRRAVEIGRQQKLAITSQLPQARQAVPQQGSKQQQSVVFEWKQGDAALVLRQHLQTAQQDMFSALHHQLLRSRSQWEKVTLVAVIVEARATGRNAVVIQNACERASNSIASLVNLQPPSLGVLQHVLVKLASMRLLLSDGAHIKAHVALNVDKDDVALAIKDDERLNRLHQLL